MAGRNLLAGSGGGQSSVQPKGRNLLAPQQGKNLIADQQQAVPQAQDEGGWSDRYLYDIPGVGPYIKSASEGLASVDKGLTSVLGRPPEGMQDYSDAARSITDTLTRGYLSKVWPEEGKRTAAAQGRLGPTNVGALGIAEGIVEPTPLSKIKLVEKAGKVMKPIYYGAEAGLDTAVNAYGHGAPLTDLPGEFVKGSGLGAAGSAIAGKVGDWWGKRQARKSQTYATHEDLRAAEKNKYKEVDASKAVYEARDLRRLHAKLKNMDLVPGTDDPAIALLAKLDKDWRGKDMTATQLDSVRQLINKKLAPNPRQKDVAGDMIKEMDAFTKKTGVVEPYAPGYRGQGPRRAATSVDPTLVEARDLHARRQRELQIIKESRRAERDVDKSALNPFGTSLESARLKRFSNIGQKIEEKTNKSKFTPAEASAVDKVAKSGKLSLRRLGGIAEHLSFSGGLGGHLSGLGLLVPGMGHVAPLVSTGAEVLHHLGTAATTREINDLRALIRDPSGKGIKADPKTVEAARAKLAQIATAGYRATANQRNRGDQ